MHDDANTPADAIVAGDTRRSTFHDANFTVLMLGLAVATGYVLLPPGAPAATPPSVARVAHVASLTPADIAPPRPVPDILTAPDATTASVKTTSPITKPPATSWAPAATTAPSAASVAARASESPGTAARPAVAAIEPARPRAESRPAPADVRAPRPEPAAEAPWPSPTVTGRVLDEDRKPLAGASVVVRGIEVRTDADGVFKVERVPPDASLLVKLPGYEKARIVPTNAPVEAQLRPQSIKAAYLTYFGVGDRGIRNRVLDLAARTELNAVVVDVKGDRGWVLYRTEVEQALAIGAQGPGTLRDFDAMMADWKIRGIYTIARIVVFKDNILATARPDLAIIDTRTGKAWIDNEKLAWVDPFREEVWAYNIALAKEAVRRGFDEVQFDYVRFPTDGKLGAAKYAKPVSKETRLPTIAAFLGKARREIGPTGAFLAADLFGYTAFNENDTDIGQRIEELAPHLDFICPMVYPSGYHKGIPGHANPIRVPYKVVHESVRLIRKRAGGTVAQVRPWLQDFRDYAFDRRIFGVPEIQAQIRGSDDGGGVGWMLWNPRNDYTGAALRAKGALAAR